MKHIHIPLQDDLHQALLREAAASGQSATGIARIAIEHELKARKRAARQRDISTYAAAVGGSLDDLDPALEAASLETF